MKIKDLLFSPHNDMNANDIETVNRHKNLINQNMYSAAVNVLESAKYQKGFRAELFNKIQDKVRNLELFILNEFVAKPDEFYSYDEPAENQMEGKIFWIKPIE